MKIYLTETTQVTKVSLLRTERGVSHGKLSETILHRLKLIAGEGERQDIPTTGTGQSLLKRKSEAIEVGFEGVDGIAISVAPASYLDILSVALEFALYQIERNEV